MNITGKISLFKLGLTVATPGALDVMHRAGIAPLQLLLRHRLGDWGDLNFHDLAANDRAVLAGARIVSAYEVGTRREKILVITSADRSTTTLLLPGEY